MNKEGLKENVNATARDIVALGSIPFFILVLVRVYLLHKPDYFSQFLIAGLLFLILAFSFKFDRYSGLGLIILIFTIRYYNSQSFTVFSSIAYVLLLLSLFYLKEGKKKIFLGTAIGALCSIISYYIVNVF